ncbi:MAG: pilus assembly protein TadG-related protein [Pseudomonadota bacterium]
MTIQVLILSILLFGTTGMVLDSGRVYQMHSKMQSFADQVALAAAAELDGEPDAIQRALRIQTGVDGTAAWDCSTGTSASNPALVRDNDSGGFEFCIERLDFYSSFDPPAEGQARTQADISAAYNNGYITDPLAEGSAEQARYVVAHVAAVQLDSAAGALYSVVQALSSAIGVSPAADQGGATVDAVSVATVVPRRCTGATTLVICNPWEGLGGSDYPDYVANDDDPDPLSFGLTGRTAMTFASTDGVRIGPSGDTPFSWTARNQLFELREPIPEGEACTDANVAAMFSGVPPSEAKAACLMARAVPDRFCFGDTVTIAPTRAATLTAAMNTTFDMRIAPFDDVQFQEDVPVAGVPAGVLFEPDRFSAHPYEPHRRDAGTPPPASVTDYLAGATHIDGWDYQQAEYQGIPATGLTMTEADSDVYSFGLHDCHIESQKAAAGLPTSGAVCSTPFVSDDVTTPNASLRAMVEGYFGPVFGGSTGGSGTGGLGSTGGSTGGGGLGSGGGGLGSSGGGLGSGGGGLGSGGGGLGSGGGTGGSTLSFPSDIDTWYETYQWVRTNQALLPTTSFGNSMTFGTGTASNGQPIPNTFDVLASQSLTDDERAYLDTAPTNYANAMTGLIAGCNPSDPLSCLSGEGERRRIRSLVVNCQAAVDAGDDNGQYEAEVIGVMDWFLSRPVTMFCGYLNPSNPADDAVLQEIYASGGTVGGTYTALDCTPATMEEARMFVEFIDDVTDTDLSERFTAQITQ